jgi:hypothetical protein
MRFGSILFLSAIYWKLAYSPVRIRLPIFEIMDGFREAGRLVLTVDVRYVECSSMASEKLNLR